MCWGYNSHDQVGDGSTTDRQTPVQVQNVSNLKFINVGYYGSCAVDMAGTGYCWGNGYLRGDGAGSNNISTPVKVGG